VNLAPLSGTGARANMEHRLLFVIGSGATKVGVTRGGNWWCHLFFPEKKTDDKKGIFSRVSHPGWCHPGQSAPPPYDATGYVVIGLRQCCVKLVSVVFVAPGKSTYLVGFCLTQDGLIKV